MNEIAQFNYRRKFKKFRCPYCQSLTTRRKGNVRECKLGHLIVDTSYRMFKGEDELTDMYLMHQRAKGKCLLVLK